MRLNGKSTLIEVYYSDRNMRVFTRNDRFEQGPNAAPTGLSIKFQLFIHFIMTSTGTRQRRQRKISTTINYKLTISIHFQTVSNEFQKVSRNSYGIDILHVAYSLRAHFESQTIETNSNCFV